MSTPQPASLADTRRLLNLILPVAIVDGLLLIPLVLASINDDDGAIGILGPIHGVGFLILIGMTAYGVLKQMWGWWFPVIVVVTGGPIGSIVGDIVIRRQLR